jgi:hypothetical protein
MSGQTVCSSSWPRHRRRANINLYGWCKSAYCRHLNRTFADIPLLRRAVTLLAHLADQQVLAARMIKNRDGKTLAHLETAFN